MTDYKLVPVEPTAAHIDSIAMRYRHDFGLLPEDQRDNLRRFARQMYEECTGQGFYQIQPAPAVQGEPVGWQCVWPGGGAFTTDSYESAKNYQEGAISSHGEDQAPFIRPLFADPKAAEQRPDVAQLVEALEEIASWVARWTSPGHPIENIARQALAAHRKQGGGV